jgi:hypothetical protein
LPGGYAAIVAGERLLALGEPRADALGQGAQRHRFVQAAAGRIAEAQIMDALQARMRGGCGKTVGRQSKFMHRFVHGRPPSSTFIRYPKTMGLEALKAG